jgi:hypothetical protein
MEIYRKGNPDLNNKLGSDKISIDCWSQDEKKKDCSPDKPAEMIVGSIFDKPKQLHDLVGKETTFYLYRVHIGKAFVR